MLHDWVLTSEEKMEEDPVNKREEEVRLFGRRRVPRWQRIG